MQEVIELVLSYARSVWLKRWYILATAWLVCLVGWAVIIQQPNQYQASARIHLDTQSVLRPLLRGLTISTSSSQQIQLMVTTLFSRPNLNKVARMTDMDLGAQSDRELDKLISNLKSDLELSKVTRDQDIYLVSYIHEDRDLAKRVVQAVLTVFAENALGQNREGSAIAKRFLDAEIKDYEVRLKEAEQKLVDFKRNNIGNLSASGADYYQRLQAAMVDVEQVKLALTEAHRERASVIEQIEDQESESESSFMFDDMGATGSSSYDGRISALQANLDSMFLKYTDKHPDVITLKAQLTDLQALREQELASRPVNVIADAGNPVLQSLKLSQSTLETKIAALKARAKTYESRVAELNRMVNTIPAVEAEVADLNRDYSVIKGKYTELLTRREQAAISQKANQASDDIEFKVIDPTRVPFEPAGPPRILYSTAVLLAGLILGVGVALLLSLIRPTFSTTRLLSLTTGLAVLGSVSLHETPQQRVSNRKYLVLYLGMAFLLLVAYSGTILYQLLFMQAVALT